MPLPMMALLKLNTDIPKEVWPGCCSEREKKAGERDEELTRLTTQKESAFENKIPLPLDDAFKTGNRFVVVAEGETV